MPRIELPSRQADDTPNWVDLKEPDDFMAADLFALHRAVKIRNNASGETEYSPAEMADDRVNSFLGFAITDWSFKAQSPIPSQVTVAAADVVLGRVLKAKDWAALRKAAAPLMDELEGEDRPDSKSGG